jgi:hypothetical protein
LGQKVRLGRNKAHTVGATSESARVGVRKRRGRKYHPRISADRSKHVQEFKNQSFDYVLTVCDNAKESCPVFPGHSNRIHKGFQDPATLQGTEEERLALFRRVRDEIRDYLKVFPSWILVAMKPGALDALGKDDYRLVLKRESEWSPLYFAGGRHI